MNTASAIFLQMDLLTLFRDLLEAVGLDLSCGMATLHPWLCLKVGFTAWTAILIGTSRVINHWGIPFPDKAAFRNKSHFAALPVFVSYVSQRVQRGFRPRLVTVGTVGGAPRHAFDSKAPKHCHSEAANWPRSSEANSESLWGCFAGSWQQVGPNETIPLAKEPCTARQWDWLPLASSIRVQVHVMAQN